MFKINQSYSRREIKSIIGLPRDIVEKNLGSFANGYPRHLNTYYVFSNLGNESKTGHNYRDRLDGNTFSWVGPENTKATQDNIVKFISDSFTKLLFVRYRINDKFTYKGLLRFRTLTNEEHPVKIDFIVDPIDYCRNTEEYIIMKQEEERYLDSLKISLDKLKEEALKADNIPSYHELTSKVYKRNQYVNSYIKKRANGYCELCGKPAPFTKIDGEPYLEVHHVVHLADNGEDTIRNCIALCPNCHRELHYGTISEEKRLRIEQILVNSFD